MTKHSASPQSIEALLFDLDGTLVDTAEDFVAVLNNQRLRHGKTLLPAELIRNTVSDGARALTHLAFGGHEGEQEFEGYRTELLKDYLDLVGSHARLFEGMDSVLNACLTRNIPWGIVTNKPRRFTEKLLQRMNLWEQCSLVLCADDVSKPKPDPESMFKAAEILNIHLPNSVYVGDHERDILSGKAARMITVSAAYGYIMDKKSVFDWGADYIIEHPVELKTLFLS